MGFGVRKRPPAAAFKIESDRDIDSHRALFVMLVGVTVAPTSPTYEVPSTTTIVMMIAVILFIDKISQRLRGAPLRGLVD